MDFAELDECMIQFEVAMEDPHNAERLRSFMMAQCDSFDTEEHLLEHTAMHEEYCALIESILEEQLQAADLDMGRLMDSLTNEYLESRVENKVVIRMVDHLHAASDFQNFHSAMTAARLEKYAATPRAPVGGAAYGAWPEPPPDLPQDLCDMIYKVQSLETAVVPEMGFWNLANRKWITVDARPSDDPQCRVNMVRIKVPSLGVPAEAACDMIVVPEMRTQWDSAIATGHYLRGGTGDDDYDVSLTVAAPLGMSNRAMHFHIVKLRDYPEPGAYLLLLARPTTDYPAASGEIKAITHTCAILARPTGPESCEYLCIDNTDFGISSFVQNQMMARMWPTIMSKVEKSYQRLFAN